jgi:hypothetical protein
MIIGAKTATIADLISQSSFVGFCANTEVTQVAGRL